MTTKPNGMAVFDSAALLDELHSKGVVLLPPLLAEDQLVAMRSAFAARLKYPTFNTWKGYEQNERWRKLVEDCLALDRGFVELALQPDLHGLLAAYLGPNYVLTEARGWETIATRRNFHGWHNDAWYEESQAITPRQIKLGVYLSQVDSGQFRYLAGSHRAGHKPGHWNEAQVAAMAQADSLPIVDVFGAVGTAFLFDTAGIHRQASPVLQPRWVTFYNFHDPATPLQAGETAYGRYQPPLLSVGQLPYLDENQQRRLGMGGVAETSTAHLPPQRRFWLLHGMIAKLLQARLLWRDLQDQLQRVNRRLRR